MFNWSPPSHVIGSHRWEGCSGGSVPEGAVKGGEDQDGGTIFIGRAFHEGDLLPAKVCPNHGCAFVSFSGQEIAKTSYEVLCSSHIAWKPTFEDDIPSQAIQVGFTASGEKLYAGRWLIDGHLTPGKVHPSHRCLYVAYAGQEHSFREYEVLILY